MPLPLPTLAARTYEQLLDEVRERLPVTAPPQILTAPISHILSPPAAERPVVSVSTAT